MSHKQKTIKKPVSLTGRGLHSGIDVQITFKPAPENTGYIIPTPVIRPLFQYWFALFKIRQNNLCYFRCFSQAPNRTACHFACGTQNCYFHFSQ